MNLDGRVTIITGAAGGIGRGIVKYFASQGAKVAMVDIVAQADGDALATELSGPGEVMYLERDITKKEMTDDIVASTVKRFGSLSVLVNCAHASKQAAFIETTQDMWDLSLGTGMYATFYLMQAAYPELKKTKGAVVNFASGAGIEGLPRQVAYAAAKEAIRAITRVAAHEWAADGIRVNLVSPIAHTPAVDQWAKAFPDDYSKMISTIPLGRMGDPLADIAPAVGFLASEESQYITGQTLMVDGGSIMPA